MSKSIMLMGTSSHVGKSIITTALCRIFHRQGMKAVPFKAQNMALNSYVTREGLEMGRAQVAQAEAAGLEPMVDMNPVLLKPTGHSCSQVIINGKPVGNMSAREYHTGYSLKAFSAVKEALLRLQENYEVLVIEGAGSPAEVNLKANDIVNMRVAKHLNAPVLLIADIDRGGALASLVGTLELLDEDERALVKGLVINKFRGDITLLQPAIDFLEEKTGKPVLGVVPHIDEMGIDDEDSVSLEEKQSAPADAKDKLRLAVIQTPKISNFTDFSSLAAEPDVELYYVQEASHLGEPDLILLPGSKNTTEDLLYLRESGLERAIQEKVQQGTPLWGICGGYQMLGEKIRDPRHMESDHDEVEGMGLLPMVTTFTSEKLLTQVKASCKDLCFADARKAMTADNMPGYEIHMGQTEFTAEVKHPFSIDCSNGQDTAGSDGAVSTDGRVLGTYIHGIFDHDSFRRQLLNALRQNKGWETLPEQRNQHRDKEAAYDRLADIVAQSLDMEKLAEIMAGGADSSC